MEGERVSSGPLFLRLRVPCVRNRVVVFPSYSYRCDVCEECRPNPCAAAERHAGERAAIAPPPPVGCQVVG